MVTNCLILAIRRRKAPSCACDRDADSDEELLTSVVSLVDAAIVDRQRRQSESGATVAKVTLRIPTRGASTRYALVVVHVQQLPYA